MHKTPTDLLRAYLKVISKRPGAQHLKEGVMIDILAHIVQVIVFAPSPDAFLGIGSSAQLCHRVRRVNSVQEDGFELVHACVGKEQSGIIQWDGSR